LFNFCFDALKPVKDANGEKQLDYNPRFSPGEKVSILEGLPGLFGALEQQRVRNNIAGFAGPQS
jgi:hypothetical protein